MIPRVRARITRTSIRKDSEAWRFAVTSSGITDALTSPSMRKTPPDAALFSRIRGRLSNVLSAESP